MIKSMTGFGQATHRMGNFSVSVEVKSLNSKQLDLHLRLPRKYIERELELRNHIANKLERGKIAINIECQQITLPERAHYYNEELFVSYYAELKKMADQVKADHHQLFQIALNSPDVIITTKNEELNEDEWNETQKTIELAMEQCDQFRISEGKALAQKLTEYIKSICKGLEEVELIAPQRVDRVRHKIKGKITDLFSDEVVDLNRLEQELIFYIERLDIQEECVRLKTHLDYFLKSMQNKQSAGKKLTFIAQEIGREINTIGSKANDAEMQKMVVMMKEELEKIKEQLNNVL